MDKNVIWTEHRNAEGRTYWFNPNTKESSWEKPEALKTPFEQALSRTQWKEYFSGGRKYYYNTETKESKWDMPDELLLLLEKVEKEAKNDPSKAQAPGGPRSIAPNFTPGQALPQGASVPLGGADPSLPQNQPSSTVNGTPNPNALAVGAHTGAALPFNTSSVLPARPNLPDDPVIPHNGFATVEEGEKAFTHLLRKAGVDASWTWDQTMRAIITDSLYKSLSTLAEKKRCWQKYVDNLKEKEREEREARLAKIRPAIRNMLKGNPTVFSYTTFETADATFVQHPIWQQAKIESERRMIFEEFVAELKQREIQESRAVRARNVNKVVALFKKLGVDVLTRWRTAYSMLLESKEWQNDEELKTLPPLDILLAFEDYSRVREREFEEKMRKEQIERTRRERKAREAFKDLLRDLVEINEIRARTKWKEVYQYIEDNERYLNLLGNPGSSPIELFWDVIDNLDQKLDAKIAVVENCIQLYNKNSQPEKPFVFDHETSEESFRRLVFLFRDGNKELQELTELELRDMYDAMNDEAIKKVEAEKRRAERKQRHMQDDLRYALKKLLEPIDINMSYEEAVPLMEHLPEFKVLEDEGRRAAFSKFIKRQKERLREREPSEDGGSTTSRRRKEPTKDKEVERDYHKDRDRDYDKEKDESKGSKHHRRGHDADYESRRDRDHRDRDYRDRDRERERDRDRDRDAYRSRYDRDRERDRGRDRNERRREDRKASRSEPDRDWEDPRYAVVHEGGGGDRHTEREKREREGSVYSDRSEKRARYESEEPPRSAVPLPPAAREETPEEGEI